MLNLMQGDCLERMAEIPTNSVDLVLTDPPYGSTSCKWDQVIPLEPMWEQLTRIIKPYGTVILMGVQPFTTILISSNLEMFKYCSVWQKTKAANFQQAKNAPLRRHEDVIVFSGGVVGHSSQTKKRMTYNPQGVEVCDKHIQRRKTYDPHGSQRENGIVKGYRQKLTNYPDSILVHPSAHNPPHPTQKPLSLMEGLVRAYSNEGDTVLDFTMGSGTTGVAARKLNRKFIGIELDSGYFELAKARIDAEVNVC